jgi:hypothetical protein
MREVNAVASSAELAWIPAATTMLHIGSAIQPTGKRRSRCEENG